LWDGALTIVLNVLMPILCILLGFCVAWQRPTEFSAWMLLLTLLGWSQLGPRHRPRPDMQSRLQRRIRRRDRLAQFALTLTLGNLPATESLTACIAQVDHFAGTSPQHNDMIALILRAIFK